MTPAPPGPRTSHTSQAADRSDHGERTAARHHSGLVTVGGPCRLLPRPRGRTVTAATEQGGAADEHQQHGQSGQERTGASDTDLRCGGHAPRRMLNRGRLPVRVLRPVEWAIGFFRSPGFVHPTWPATDGGRCSPRPEERDSPGPRGFSGSHWSHTSSKNQRHRSMTTWKPGQHTNTVHCSCRPLIKTMGGFAVFHRCAHPHPEPTLDSTSST